jgi:hypothetical protein
VDNVLTRQRGSLAAPILRGSRANRLCDTGTPGLSVRLGLAPKARPLLSACLTWADDVIDRVADRSLAGKGTAGLAGRAQADARLQVVNRPSRRP